MTDDDDEDSFEEFHKPREKELVWNEDRIALGRQPNGYIANIIWEGGEVIVMYHDSDEEDFDIFTFAQLQQAYEPAMFGGSYMFYKGIIYG